MTHARLINIMLVSKIRSSFLWTLAILALLLLIARLSLPSIVQSGFSYWFEQQGIDASIDDVSFDLSNGRILLTGIKGEKQGNNAFRLSSLSIHWTWAELQDNHVRINDIKLDGLKVAAVKHSADIMVVAGIDPAKLATDETAGPKKTNKVNQWKVSLDALSLKTTNLCYTDKTRSNLDYCSQLGELTWHGDLVFDLAQLTSDVVPLFANGNLTLGNWLVQNNHLQRNLLALASASINGISIDTLNDIRIAKTSLNSLQLLQRNNDTLATDVSGLDMLSVDELQFNQTPEQVSSLRVSLIKVEDHKLFLLKNKNEQLEINEWLPGNVDPTAPKSESTDSKIFQFSVDQFVYESAESIAYIDQSLAEPFRVNLKNTQIKISNIDSTKPEQDSEVNYSAQYADHGQLKLAGIARPLTAKPSFAIEGELKGLDLRDVSAFTKSRIGHSIKSGQLDAKLKLVADNSMLDSRVDLSLYQFQLKSLSKADTEKLDSAIGFPLNPALSLLRDRDDSIHLSIPITGDLLNPNFAADQALRKAFTKAMSLAVIGYFTPFGLVPVADKLFTLATTLRFDPIKFEPASSVTGSSATENLSKIIKFMEQRPQIHITLCSFTNSADRSLLLPETETRDSTNQKNLQLNSEQQSKLTALANQRSAKSKQLLVDGGIDPSRLVLCAAEHVEGKGLGGVELRI